MLDTAEKMRRRAEEAETRQAELSLTIRSTTPKCDELVASIKAAKGEFEAALSKQLGGKRIKLMGEINSL